MLQYALKELIRRRSRSLLLLFGLVVCTALLAASLSISQAMRNAARQPFQSANADLVVQKELATCPFALVKHAGKLGGIPWSAVEEIRKLPGVEIATGVLELWATSGPEETDRAVVTGLVPEDQHRIGPVKRGEDCCNLADHEVGGRYLNEEDDHACLVEKPYAEKHGLGLGGQVTLGGEPFTVVGTLEAAPGARISAGEVYIPLAKAQDLLGEETVNAIMIRAKDQDAAKAIERELPRIIPVDTAQGEKLVVTNDANVMSSVAGVALLAQSATTWMAALVVGVVFLLVVKSSLASVGERVREIGTMKAVGWRDAHVARLLALESALVGMIGGAVGTATGWGAAWLYTSHTSVQLPSLLNSYPACAQTPPPVDMHFSLAGSGPLVIGAFLVALAIGVISGYLAARRASTLPPAEALRRV
ncbi:MAG TPA: FtsX-like permease family protein [Armatimonadetes bacterium]|jgi:ABC-type lipoprotein release transport system permease subunit|nr:FtsX-like permease family protein [Armatimonadota bacterium]